MTNGELKRIVRSEAGLVGRAALIAFVLAVHALIWTAGREKAIAPDVDEPLASVSYSPFQRRPSEIRADLKRLLPYTRVIRLYSSTDGAELVPPLAAELGLKVTVGAWLGNDPWRNQRELRKAVELASKNRNVDWIVIGNETIFRGETVLIGAGTLSQEESSRLNVRPPEEARKVKEDISVARLIKLIQQVRRETNGRVPVTTGEIWDTWLRHPELVASVDSIAAHILPYWEGVSPAHAVDAAIDHYNQLRQAYPGKRIVIAEFGWPSSGYNRLAAIPGRIEQAIVLRNFVSRMQVHGIDYNIVEAYDAPWKSFGSTAAYWGIFDASQQPKFAWTGPISDSKHWRVTIVAIATSLLLSVPILLMASATLGQVLLLSISANVVGAWAAAIFAYWTDRYFTGETTFVHILGLLLLVPLVAVTLWRMWEIAQVSFPNTPHRLGVSSEADQRYTIRWLRAESIGVVLALLSLIWVPSVVFVGIVPEPDKTLTLPIIAAFLVSAAHFMVRHRRPMAAVLAALVTRWTSPTRRRRPILRSLNTVAKPPEAFQAVLGVLLAMGAVVVLWTNGLNVRETNLFSYALFAQSIPFLSAAILAVLAGSRGAREGLSRAVSDPSNTLASCSTMATSCQDPSFAPKTVFGASLSAAWAASKIGAISLATLLILAKLAREMPYFVGAGYGHIQDLLMISVAGIAVLVLSLLFNFIITIPASVIAARCAYPILRRHPVLPRGAFRLGGFLLGSLVWFAIWKSGLLNDLSFGSWLSVFVAGGLAGYAGALAFTQHIAARPKPRAARRIGAVLLAILGVGIAGLFIRDPSGMFLLAAILIQPLAANTHPPLIAENELASTSWQNQAQASRTLTTLLQRKYPAGTGADLLKSTLLDQGFKPYRLAENRSHCLLPSTGNRTICDTYDPDETFQYTWGQFPCGSHILIWWTTDDSGNIVNVSGSYTSACL